MKKQSSLTVLAFLLLLAIGLCAASCGTNIQGTPAAEGNRAAERPAAMSVKPGGAQLWAENCMRCHNMRSPSSYSDAEWEVAVHHMRVRANLTAEEARTIIEFLKASN